MTTRMRIENDVYSNCDIGIIITGTSTRTTKSLAPGEKLEEWINSTQRFEITEFWPTKAPPVSDVQKRGAAVDAAIAREVAVQIAMWGTNRPDNKSDELLGAALASASAVHSARTMPDEPMGREGAFMVAQENYYPESWSPDAFRDYGSDFANLAVAAAFIRNQMLAMLAKGESTTRSKRAEPYKSATPFITAQQAGASS